MMSSLPLTSPLSSALPGLSAPTPGHGAQPAHAAPSGFAQALDQAKAPPAEAPVAASREATPVSPPSGRPAPAPRRTVPQRETAHDMPAARAHRLDAKVGETGAAAARFRAARLAAGEAERPLPQPQPVPVPGIKPDPLPLPAESEGPMRTEDGVSGHGDEPTRPLAPPDCVAGPVAPIQPQLPPNALPPSPADTAAAPAPVAPTATGPAAPSAGPAGPELAAPMAAHTFARAAAVAAATAAASPANARTSGAAEAWAEARPATAAPPAAAAGAVLMPAAALATPSVAPVEGGSTAKSPSRPDPAGSRPAAEAPAAAPDRAVTPPGSNAAMPGQREAPPAAFGALDAAPVGTMSSQQAAAQSRSPAPVRAETAAAPEVQAPATRTSGPAASEGERRAAPANEAQAVVPQPVAFAAALAAPVQAGGGDATAQARLSARPDSPEFAPQLGAQITTFVRDGIEHAQLHLNPAEMGPVSVRIQLDGQTAQVHLSADHALTRQALEASMPQLASQLSEAGLTLGGGGVFEQPRQGRDAPPQGNRGDGGRSGDSDGTRPRGIGLVAPVQPPMRRGVVDLVA